MIFKGISKTFSLKNEDQYNTIGEFWDELSLRYGLENLMGLGYKWDGGIIYYAIGLKAGEIDGANLTVELPDDGWEVRAGLTDQLKEMYDDIYRDGALSLELETFTDDGICRIRYIRKQSLGKTEFL